MTEKGMEDNKTRLLNARKGKLAQFTSMKKQLEELTADDVNTDLVKNKLRVDFGGLQTEFTDINYRLQQYMSEEEFLENQAQYFEPKQASMTDFFWKCESWMKDVMKRAEQAKEQECGAEQTDSRSVRTKRSSSRRSTVKSASSMKMKAELQRASLQAQAAAVMGNLAIEQEEAELKRQEAELQAEQRRKEAAIKAKKEMHQIKTKLAESDAQLQVLQKYEDEQDGASSCESDAPDDKEPVKSTPLLLPQHAAIAQNYSQPSQPDAFNYSVSVRPKVKSENDAKKKESETVVLDSLCQAITQQANVTEYLVKNHKASLLPVLTIKTFKGDPLEYKSFIRSIEHGIESRTENDRDRLQFLLQYTSGQPHELVKSCIHMPPSIGYAKAKQMLQEYFGDDYKIAEAYLKEAMDWQTIKPEDGAALQSFALFLTGCSNTMADISYMEDLDNAACIKALASKLPYRLKESWRKHACDLQDKTKKRLKFKDFVEFVNKQVKYLLHPLYGNIKDNTTNTKDSVRQKPKPQDKDMTKSKKVFTTSVVLSAENKDKKEKESSAANKTKSVDVNEKPCLYCNGEHHTFAVCKGFKKKPHKEKLEYLRSKGLCFACLKHGHMSSSCTEKAQCQECARSHPTLLHITFKETKEEMTKDQEKKDEQAVTNALVQASELCSVTGAGKEDCFLSIVPVQVKAQKGTKIVTTYAFLDPGSSATFATESLMNELNLNGRCTSISLRTMGNESVVKTHIVTGMEISSLEGDQFIELSEVYSQKDIPVTKDNIPRQEDVSRWPHLQEVKLPAVEAEVGLLIGANIPKAMEPLQVVSSVNDGPYAVRTALGWTVNGPLRGGNDGLRTRSPVVTANRISVARLEELWHQQFKLDLRQAGQSENIEMSKEDHQFMNMVSQSAQLKDGHYTICLPLRNKSLCMPNNRSVAEQRALNLRKRFMKDADYRAEYVAFMEDILKKGYAVQISSAEYELTEGRTWYLPHHGVRHPVKCKLRVVFDCAASFGGTSLNQQLLQGPDLTSSLVGVLTRFRQENIAFMADVEAMFYQVAVKEEDTNLLRFLWWPEGNHQKELAEFKMKVHIFGATSSPSVATYAMQRCAADFEEEFGQEAATTVKKNFYVDDCLKSVADEDAAVTLCCNLRGMLARGSFRLTKWASNSRKLINSIPEDERAQGFQDLDLNMDSLPMERALGIQWCAETDQFKIKINLKERPHTRRGLLSFLSSIFDPLGFIAPVVLPAKKILQELCRQRYSWDDSLPEDVIKEWTRWSLTCNS